MVLSNTALLYAKLEEALRQAMGAGSHVTIPELYAKPDVHRVATKRQQVQDCVRHLRESGCLIETEISDKAQAKRRGSRLAFAWKDGENFILKGRFKEQRELKKPSPVISTKFAKPNQNEVELVLNGIEIIAGVNPETGRIRIIIGGQ